MSACMLMCEIVPDCSVDRTNFIKSILKINKQDRIGFIKEHILNKYPDENLTDWSYQDLCDYIESCTTIRYTGSNPEYMGKRIDTLVLKPSPFWCPSDALYIRKKYNQYKKLLKITDPIQYESFDGSNHIRIPFLEVCDENGDRVYRQGWFFTSKFLNSVCQYRICTSVYELRKTLDKIIDVKKRRNDSEWEQSMSHRGLEAYQYFIKTFSDLSSKYPEKKYFVIISF